MKRQAWPLWFSVWLCNLWHHKLSQHCVIVCPESFTRANMMPDPALEHAPEHALEHKNYELNKPFKNVSSFRYSIIEQRIQVM